MYLYIVLYVYVYSTICITCIISRFCVRLCIDQYVSPRQLLFLDYAVKIACSYSPSLLIHTYIAYTIHMQYATYVLHIPNTHIYCTNTHTYMQLLLPGRLLVHIAKDAAA